MAQLTQTVSIQTASTKGPRRAFRAYFALTKPRVIELLLVTTVPAMVLAARGWPGTFLVLAVLFGGALSAGGANAANCWIERDSDRLMRRTHRRPLPAGEITPRAALLFAIALEVVAGLWLALTVNVLSSALAVGAALFYVFVYTLWLKPRSQQNIVIGGAAGAAPALIGWAAVTGSLSWSAWLMFALVFTWTPPHFWAIAIRYADEYSAADIPMLPVVRGTRIGAWNILLYSFGVVALSLILIPVASLDVIYIGTACFLGIAILTQALRLLQDPTSRRAYDFFRFSNVYLALLFGAIAVDILIANH